MERKKNQQIWFGYRVPAFSNDGHKQQPHAIGAQTRYKCMYRIQQPWKCRNFICARRRVIPTITDNFQRGKDCVRRQATLAHTHTWSQARTKAMRKRAKKIKLYDLITLRFLFYFVSSITLPNLFIRPYEASLVGIFVRYCSFNSIIKLFLPNHWRYWTL